MYIDRIDLSLPEEMIAGLLASFTSAKETLAPLPSVGSGDRKHLAKLGLKNEGLARQIIEVGRANPGVIPRDIDFEQIDRDLVAREQLRSLKIVLEALLGKVTDSMLLTGVDIYAGALSIYHCLRRNAQTTSLRSAVEELKNGFARPSRKKKPEPETAQERATESKKAPSAPEPRMHEAAAAGSAPSDPQSALGVTKVHIQYPAFSPQQKEPPSNTFFLVPTHALPQSFSSWIVPTHLQGGDISMSGGEVKITVPSGRKAEHR